MRDVSDWSVVRTRPRPLTITEILDGMFDLFVANWRAYVLAVGTVIVPTSFVTAYLTVNISGGAGLLEQFTSTAEPADLFQGSAGRSFLGLIAVTVLVAIFVTPPLEAIASRIAADGYHHRETAPGEVLLRCLRRYPSIAAVSLLVLGLSALIAAPGIGLIVIGIVQSSPGPAIVGGLLLTLAVLPIVWLVVQFSLAYVCIVVEGAGPITALRRSRTLVKGQWGRVFVTLILANFIATVVAQIVAIPLQIPGTAWGEWAAVALGTVAGVLVALLTTPLTANARTLLYFDARVRREGYDLALLIDEVSAPPAEQRIG